MPTIAQVEEQIYTCEGFRVRVTPLKPATKTLPPYDFLVMAPQRWKISDWKNARLRGYVTLVRDVTVLRGDGEPVKIDMQLGNLRDSYYGAKYGSLSPEHGASDNVVPMPERSDDAAPAAKPKRPRSR